MAISAITRRLGVAPKLAMGGKVKLIVALFVGIAILLAGMIYLQGNIADGVRAYVRGEGLWAKAQKDAVLYLERYSYSRSGADDLAFQKSMEVFAGDGSARMALSQNLPDEITARQGFLGGQNSPEDVDSLIWFFLHFQNVSYMHDAIEIWEIADKKMAELASVGDAIRSEIQSNGNSPKNLNGLRMRLHRLNTELLELENRFSTVLGEGARWVKRTVWFASLGILAVFIGIGLFVSRQIIRGIATAEKALIISESRFRSLNDSNTIGIACWGMDGIVHEANDICLGMLGCSRAELDAGQINWQELTPPEYRERDQQAIAELVAQGRCTPFEKAFTHKEGYPVPVYVGASMIRGDSNQGIAYVIDLSERKKAEEQLRLAATVFAASNDGILITDAAMHILSANHALSVLTGYGEEELQGHTPKILQSGLMPAEKYSEMWDSIRENGHWHGDVIDRNKYGALLPLSLSISSVKSREGRVTHYAAIMTDISARKAEEEQLRHIAHHDALTGLPNRMLLTDRIEQLVKHAARYETKFAILFFDLDKFKPVNDRFGHAVGDKLLQIVAKRLTMNVRSTDTVTRLGGDEFVILVENILGLDEIDQVLGKTLATVCAPCAIDGHEMSISVSVGVSIYPEHGSDVESLMHHADLAMYGMKKMERA